MRKILKPLGLFGLAVVGLLVVTVLLAAWRPMWVSRVVWPLIENAVIDPFVGITEDGVVVPDLFAVASTGVSTAPVVSAAARFLELLTPEQRARTLFAVDDSEWRRWANIHASTRQGVGLLELDEKQKAAAFELLQAGLSRRGYATARDIMRLEGHLADLMDNYREYGEERYWFTVMGEPSADAPWGWQLDGHHLIVNFFVLGDQVVMTPTFMGSEPVMARSGPYVGTRVFEAEQNAGLALMKSLTPAQQDMATLAADKVANDNRGELFQDNAVVPRVGLPLSTLDARQAELAVRLIRLYVDHIRPGHSEVRFQEVMAHWDDTTFAWVGQAVDDAVFYYRVQSPVIMIEFDHQSPVALDGPDLPTRDHVHTVVRTPNGNDYGKDLLRQHLAAHPH